MVPGTFWGVEINPKDTTGLDQDEIKYFRNLMHNLLDSIVCYLFLHSSNMPKKKTKKNLGRAVSVNALRVLIAKYLSSKNWNIDNNRESENQQIKTKLATESCIKEWGAPENAQRFIDSSLQQSKGWWKLVLTGGLSVIFAVFGYFDL